MQLKTHQVSVTARLHVFRDLFGRVQRKRCTRENLSQRATTIYSRRVKAFSNMSGLAACLKKADRAASQPAAVSCNVIPRRVVRSDEQRRSQHMPSCKLQLPRHNTNTQYDTAYRVISYHSTHHT